MKKILILMVMVLVANSIAAATILDWRCNDAQKLIRKINFQRTEINKIGAQCKNLRSLKLKIRKITGLNKLKTQKALPFKTLQTVIKLVNAEYVKIGIVARSYRSINKYSVNLRKNILILGKEINQLTEKWKKRNLLKFKINCLRLLHSQLQKLKMEVTKIKLTPFAYGNPKSLNVSSMVGNMKSKMGDGEYRADEARLAAKRWEMMQNIADSDIDEAKNNYEEAKEQFKLAMRILSEHMERMTQVTQKITS